MPTSWPCRLWTLLLLRNLLLIESFLSIFKNLRFERIHCYLWAKVCFPPAFTYSSQRIFPFPFVHCNTMDLLLLYVGTSCEMSSWCCCVQNRTSCSKQYDTTFFWPGLWAMQIREEFSSTLVFTSEEVGPQTRNRPRQMLLWALLSVFTGRVCKCLRCFQVVGARQTDME